MKKKDRTWVCLFYDGPSASAELELRFQVPALNIDLLFLICASTLSNLVESGDTSSSVVISEITRQYQYSSLV